MRAIIVGAGRGVRLMPHTSEEPKCLLDGLGGRKLLDWTVEALYGADIHDIVFVGGYHIDKVRLHAPSLKFVHNDGWAANNILASLFYAEDHFCDDFIATYADTVYSSASVRALLESDADATLVVDRNWRNRYVGRDAHPETEAEKVVCDGDTVAAVGKGVDVGAAHAEFIGLARFRGAAVSKMRAVYGNAVNGSQSGIGRADDVAGAYLTDMIEELIADGVAVKWVDVVGDWIEIDTPQDLEIAQEFLKGGSADSLTREFWAVRAEKYEELEWAQRSDYLKSVVESAELNSECRVLEVGTGTGIVAHAMAPFAGSVTGIDISPDMLQQARDTARPHEKFEVGDVRKLQFPDNSFDRVVGRMIFHHIMPDPMEGLSECLRVLAPSGLMVLSEGTPPAEHVRQWYTEMFALKEERLTFLESDLRELMERAGFEIHNVVVHVSEQVSIGNWLRSSGLPAETQDQIYRMHLDLDDRGKQLYNMTVTDDDILCDFKFVNVVGRNPA